jgi:hypothetical protein
MMDALDLGRAIIRIRDSGTTGEDSAAIMGEFHEVMQTRALDSVRRSTAAYYCRRFDDPDYPLAMGRKPGPLPRLTIEI